MGSLLGKGNLSEDWTLYLLVAAFFEGRLSLLCPSVGLSALGCFQHRAMVWSPVVIYRLSHTGRGNPRVNPAFWCWTPLHWQRTLPPGPSSGRRPSIPLWWVEVRKRFFLPPLLAPGLLLPSFSFRRLLHYQREVSVGVQVSCLQWSTWHNMLMFYARSVRIVSSRHPFRSGLQILFRGRLWLLWKMTPTQSSSPGICPCWQVPYLLTLSQEPFPVPCLWQPSVLSL